MEDLRHPIGKFAPKEFYAPKEIEDNIARIESLPKRLAKAVAGFDKAKFDTPYRDGGWTVRQLIHHIADSHLNAYIRFKWTLTEENPTIKAYDEKLWATTGEVNSDPQLSINLLQAHHIKWVELLKRLTPSDLKRSFIHPETKNTVTLERILALYAWHSDHHLAHITRLKDRMSW